jgi:hypothetical protein
MKFKLNLESVRHAENVRRGRAAKSKGKRYEKAIAEAIAKALDAPESDVVRTRSGMGDADIELSENLKARFPFHIECKDHKSLHLPDWIRQAEEAAERLGHGMTPIVVFKQRRGVRSVSYVTIEMSAFLQLVLLAFAGE